MPKLLTIISPMYPNRAPAGTRVKTTRLDPVEPALEIVSTPLPATVASVARGKHDYVLAGRL